ncbi:hypothetical protein GWK47_042737 [Chionoecetes opilio]|uniref:Uncharacterized protein n=1 Tax=Chionoecetes opilio TaxID=41210 RepID=A0A8J4YA57_CHIOP|nr:hypothetical protein GWK47_042737 [Chionoecetes opilio]
MSLSFKPEIPFGPCMGRQVVTQSSGRKVMEEWVAVLGSGEDRRNSGGSCVLQTGQDKLLRKPVEAGREKQLGGNITGMALDKTAANTGMGSRSVYQDERALEKPPGVVACRHHILD